VRDIDSPRSKREGESTQPLLSDRLWLSGRSSTNTADARAKIDSSAVCAFQNTA